MSISGEPIDHWIRRHVHTTDFFYADHRSIKSTRRSRVNGARKLLCAQDRSVWLSLGHCLKAQFDSLATPIPQRIAALVEQLENADRTTSRHWLDYDPVALAVLVIGIGIIELFALMI